MAEIRENPRAFRKNDYGLENALAKLVRGRWPVKTIPHVQAEYGLSESEAAKVVYANASKNTLNKLLHHPRGGFGLYIQLIEDVTRTNLESYIHTQAERAEHERRTWEAEERRLAVLHRRVSGADGMARGRVEPLRSDRSADEGLGADPVGAPVTNNDGAERYRP